jgi:hypothetical protein
MPRKNKAAVELGRRGGAARTPAKAAAAAANGLRGGRPGSSPVLRITCTSIGQANDWKERAAAAGLSLSEWVVERVERE